MKPNSSNDSSRENRDDEQQLVELAAAGDSSAFGVLYERYLDAIYRYIYFRVENEAETEDLTEETFVKAWEALPKFNYREYGISAWLYRIAHNLVIDHHRKRKPLVLPELERADLPSHTLPIEERLDKKQDIEKMLRAVKTLTEEEQQVVLLRFIEGLSHREIGKIIGKSEGASRVIQHRALANLREIMEAT